MHATFPPTQYIYACPLPFHTRLLNLRISFWFTYWMNFLFDIIFLIQTLSLKKLISLWNCIFQVCCAYQIFWFFLITFHYWLYRNRNQQLFILQILETSLYFLHSLSLFITDSTFVSVNTLNTPKKMQFFVTLVNAVCSNSCPFFPAGSYRVLVWRETPHSWRMRRLCNLVKLCGF